MNYVNASVLYLVLAVAALITNDLNVAAAPPKGNAAWVYDVKGGQPAMWAPQIGGFNQGNVNHSISIVYSYGGDMEYYPDLGQPYQTYFDASSQQAAKTYSQTQGVKSVICVVDGRMDGGEDWSPDLSKLTIQQVDEWADVTAELYCSYPQVAGIQVDLEPFRPPYVAHVIEFVRRLSTNLRSKDNNCMNVQYPNGRFVSVFLFAAAATSEVFQALGPNGFAIISGYDLGSNPPGFPNTPQQFGMLLTKEINTIVQNAGTSYFFSIGIPAAASTHEFTNYTQVAGSVSGYPMYAAQGDSYLKEAFANIQATHLRSNPQFLGLSLWGFSSEMAYPAHSLNKFYPANPFVQDGEESYLKSML